MLFLKAWRLVSNEIVRLLIWKIMKRKYWMFGVAAVVLLSGCRASRVEQSPAADVKLPSAYDTTSSTDTAIDTMSMAMLSWDSFFTDTLLQHCIGEA